MDMGAESLATFSLRLRKSEVNVEKSEEQHLQKKCSKVGKETGYESCYLASVLKSKNKNFHHLHWYKLVIFLPKYIELHWHKHKGKRGLVKNSGLWMKSITGVSKYIPQTSKEPCLFVPMVNLVHFPWRPFSILTIACMQMARATTGCPALSSN